MPENFTDPAGNTEAFRAFAHPAEPDTSAAAPSRTPMIVGAVVVAIVLIALATWLALG